MPLVARGGGAWLAVSAVVVAAVAVLAWLAGSALPWALAAVLAVLWLLLLNFFRDPERPVAEGLCCPADGVVVRLDAVEDPDLGPAQRVAVFMSPLDVHVNRYPLDGTVLEVRHLPGGKVPAFRKESDRNERVETLLRTAWGPVKVVQIAGAVARRIVPYHRDGDLAQRGQRMGLIRLGSRCDVLVPDGTVEWSVALRQKVKAGSTALGTLRPAAPLKPAKRLRTTAAGPAQAPRRGGAR